MMTRRERKTKGRRIAMIGVVAVLLVTVRTIPSQAVSRVRLSQTKRTYDMTGLWDKLKLKNVSSKAKIRWKTTDSKVVKIRERKGAGIWSRIWQGWQD